MMRGIAAMGYKSMIIFMARVKQNQTYRSKSIYGWGDDEEERSAFTKISTFGRVECTLHLSVQPHWRGRISGY